MAVFIINFANQYHKRDKNSNFNRKINKINYLILLFLIDFMKYSEWEKMLELTCHSLFSLKTN